MDIEGAGPRAELSLKIPTRLVEGERRRSRRLSIGLASVSLEHIQILFNRARHVVSDGAVSKY